MSKKTLGIVFIVIAALGLLGGIANGSLFTMGILPLIGFLAPVVALLYFGIKWVSGK